MQERMVQGVVCGCFRYKILDDLVFSDLLIGLNYLSEFTWALDNFGLWEA